MDQHFIVLFGAPLSPDTVMGFFYGVFFTFVAQFMYKVFKRLSERFDR